MKKTLLALSIVLLAAGCSSSGLSSSGKNTSNTGQNSTSTSSSNQISGYTMAEVAAANGPQKCWVVISGKVYDITKWYKQHPGGPDKILSICGKDGTSAYQGKHGGEKRPASVLESFYIGNLKQ